MPTYTSGSAITPIEGLFGMYAMATFKPATLDDLKALTGMQAGDLAFVNEISGLFVFQSGSWVQQTPGRIASANARDTAYGRASGSYRTLGAAVYRTDTGAVESYLPQYNSTTAPAGARVAGWYPTGGRIPFFAAGPSGTQSIAASTITKLTNWTLQQSEGFTVYSAGTLTAMYAGIYDISATITTGGSSQIIVYQNGNAVQYGTGGGSSLVSTSLVVTAGDTIDVRIFDGTAESVPTSGRQRWVVKYVRPY